jgi:myo-inositol-1(or 4)-monophosphatase
MGSAALDMCYVACGRFDGFYEVGLQPWDVAAGTLIVKQAGGVADDFKKTGNPVFAQQIIASTPEAFAAVWPIIGKYF